MDAVTAEPTTAKPPRRSLMPLPLAVGLSVVIVSTVAVAGISAYGAHRINRSRQRWFTDKFVLTPESLRIAYKTVALTTEDGVDLEGWWMEQTVRGRPSDRIVVGFAPFLKDKSSLLAVARALWDTGHSVLLFDFRAFAPKQAAHETIGYLEVRDGRAALAWVRANKPPSAKIGLIGCSMGGAVALTLACEDDTDLACVVTDCAFASLEDVTRFYLAHHLFPRAPPAVINVLLRCVCAWTELLYGYNPHDVGPKHKLDKLRVPLLLIHSNNDSVVPLEQARIIFENVATPPESKECFVVPQCEHIGFFFADEMGYTRKIVSFLDSKGFAHAKPSS